MTSPQDTGIGWKQALIVMILCHGTATLLVRLIPTIAPEVVRQYGYSASFIGWIATVANCGSILVIAMGSGLLRAVGSIRAIRLGLMASIAGCLVMLAPVPALALLAGLVIGLGHGPTNPAGNELLNRVSPPDRRSLIFSIKQSAVPLGGVLGGLTLPGIAGAWGVEAAILAGVALAVVALALTLPLHRRQRVPVAPGALMQAFQLSALIGPLVVVMRTPPLRRLAWTGFLLAFVQSVWFVYLTAYLALSVGYGAAMAGFLFALMQGTSIAGRIGLGWMADRIGRAWPLITLSLAASAVVTMGLAAAGAAGPSMLVVAVVGLGGVAVAGWNGVHVSEAVRVAVPGQFYESVSGVTLAIGVGVVGGPLFMSVMLDSGAGWTAALVASGVAPLIGLGWARWR